MQGAKSEIEKQKKKRKKEREKDSNAGKQNYEVKRKQIYKPIVRSE